MEVISPTDPALWVPSFIFQIVEMREHPLMRPREEGVPPRWLPPRKLGQNYVQHSSPYFLYHQGTIRRFPELPDAAELYKDLSMYYTNDSREFFAVSYDATQYIVGDGTHGNDDPVGAVGSQHENETDDDDGNRIVDDWRGIGFGYPQDPPVTGKSRVMIGGAHPTLRMRRANQAWANEIFPGRYRPTELVPEHIAREHGYTGGMYGDIPLLLGLIAFSIPTPQVGNDLHLEQILRACLHANGWRAHGRETPNGAGRTNQHRRGVVVHVWTHPQIHGSTDESLDACGRGSYGPIYR